MDKMIHASEFRLRVLLTNKCNKNCAFCLNDFQSKGDLFAPSADVIDCIRAYGQFMKFNKGEESIITFSGGEPGLHPHLTEILASARYHCDVVKVATNGLAITRANTPYVDKFNVGMYQKEPWVIRANTDKIAIQTVVTDDMDLDYIQDFVDFYRDADIPVKLFVDYFSKNKADLYSKILSIKDTATRFTGKQINRGPACAGCKKECVTLKALWYFPDGTASTCPQGDRQIYWPGNWDEVVEKAYTAHKKEK